MKWLEAQSDELTTSIPCLKMLFTTRIYPLSESISYFLTRGILVFFDLLYALLEFLLIPSKNCRHDLLQKIHTLVGTTADAYPVRDRRNTDFG